MKRTLWQQRRWAMLFVPWLAMAVNSVTAQTNFSILRSFASVPDGAVPECTLVDGNDGAFYGTTIGGGSSNVGTVFRLAKDGSAYAVLKSFTGPDGAYPEAGLVLGTNGSLFGTTYAGGMSNLGTVFSLGRNGSGFALLHSFLGASDSANPRAALIEGSDGALYGTTLFGNSATRGTVFTINQDGSGYSILHAFTGNPDGQQPYAKLLEGSDGALYGVTPIGGPTFIGTIFTLQKDGSGYAVLYNFQTTGGDGRGPSAGLLEASDGVLCGPTGDGGSADQGSIFKINKDGSGYGQLRSFLSNGADGEQPDGELVEGTDGALYGATAF